MYLDDMFVFSKTLEEHEHHLRMVFDTLKGASLFLSRKKCSLYAGSIDCLGHIIDVHGIHITVDKMDKICNWRTPRGTEVPQASAIHWTVHAQFVCIHWPASQSV